MRFWSASVNYDENSPDWRRQRKIMKPESDPLYIEFRALLGNPYTTTKDVEAAGWKMECNEGGCYWRHQATQKVMPIPQWAKEWSFKSAASARECLRNQMRNILGLK